MHCRLIAPSPQEFLATKKVFKTGVAFLRHYAEIIYLVIDANDCEALLQAEGSWVTVEKQLQRVVCSSKIGRDIFQDSVLGILDALLERTCNEAIQQVLEEETVPKASLAGAKRQALANVQNIPNVDLIKHTRSIKLNYRGMPLELKIAGMEGEIEARFAARLKGQSVANGQLEAMVLEKGIVPAAEDCKPIPHWVMEPLTAKSWSLARGYAARLLRAAAPGQGKACTSIQKSTLICRWGRGVFESIALLLATCSRHLGRIIRPALLWCM